MQTQLLEAISREGVLASVSIRFWRAAKKLEAADLGLKDQQIADRLVVLGHKRLLPREAMARFALIESRAHACVERNSFSFLGGIARFVPNRNLAKLNETLDGLKDEFAAEIESFMAKYEDLRESALDEWRDAARTLNVPVGEFVDRIASTFPSGIKLRQRFHFDSHFYQVSAPESVQLMATSAADQTAIVQARAAIASQAAEKLGRDTESFVSDCVATLREQTASICDEMLAAMKSGKTDGVHQKTLNRLLGFIDSFKTMNFAGDEALETMLSKARRDLLSKTAEEYRDNASAQVQLTTGLKKLGDEARRLATHESREIVERFGKLGARRFNLVA
jgi:hypothetical protein